MALLQMIQDVSDEIGLPRPSAVIASTDTQTRQLLAAANREGKDLATRHRWSALQVEKTHTTLGAQLQGTVESIMPGFNWLLNETMWNRSLRERVGGPLTPIDWQLLQASTVSGPYADFRIRQGKLYMFPAPTVSQTIGLEYISRYWCQDTSADGQDRWAADDDTGVLSEDIMTLGTIWRWKKSKGFDYAEDFRTYEEQVANAISRDGSARVLSMDEMSMAYVPTIRAPIGSWSP